MQKLKKMTLKGFMKRFNTLIPEENGCILWMPRTRRSRTSYQVFKGDIPNGMFVLHTCDAPHCVNPDHLWLGTHNDNMKDCITKGRHYWQNVDYSGDKSPHAKILSHQIKELREKFATGTYDIMTLAKEYCISIKTVKAFIKGRRRIDAGGPIVSKRYVLNSSDLKKINDLYDSGIHTQGEISKMFNVTQTRISQITKKRF